MAIANRAHFVWLGDRLPDLACLCVQSALVRGGFESVTLWMSDTAALGEPQLRRLQASGPITVRHLHDVAPFADAAVQARLDELDRQLAKPAARADVWRLRVLWAEGGIYLDADAVVLRPFAELLGHAAFAGLEPVCLPAALYRSKNPLRWARAGALLGVRHALTLRAGAGARFARVQGWFDLACNNAVLGAERHSPFVAELLQQAAAMPPAQAAQLYELGPRLLEGATGNRSAPACTLLPPRAFYPLGPEVCADYVADDPSAKLGNTPDAACYAAHLYDSVLARRLGHPIDAAWLRQHRQTTLLGRMVAPLLED